MSLLSRKLGLSLLVAVAAPALILFLLSGPINRPAVRAANAAGLRYATSFASLVRASTVIGPDRRCCASFDLRLRNAAKPAAFPSRPLTVGAVDRLGPNRKEAAQVEAYLHQRGLAATWSTGQPWVTVSGRPARLNRVFRVRVLRYRTPNGVGFVAARATPKVPLDLRRMVAGAGRISTYSSMHSAVVLGGFSPTALMKAYDITPLRSAGLDGAGETVAFPEIDGVDTAALHDFDSIYHLPAANLTIHGSRFKNGDEATMDVEVVHAIAPRARLVVYDLNAKVSNANWSAQSLKMVRANRGAIISSSVGGCDGTYNAADAQDYASVMTQADLLGISFFASSGDNGAFDCLAHGQTPSNQALGVDMPAALPGVTGVGGTTLAVSASGAWARETVWEGPIETSGGGGGASKFFSRPSWQKGPGVPRSLTQNPSGNRMVPDVSADADPVSGAAIVFPEGASQGGGTSQAAPIWAGITALIDQDLQHHGLSKMGFMNPALYHLASTAQPYPPFHDVTVGTNLYYPAGPGYDMASGLGSPDAWNLARDLVAYQRGRGQ